MKIRVVLLLVILPIIYEYGKVNGQQYSVGGQHQGQNPNHGERNDNVASDLDGNSRRNEDDDTDKGEIDDEEDKGDETDTGISNGRRGSGEVDEVKSRVIIWNGESDPFNNGHYKDDDEMTADERKSRGRGNNRSGETGDTSTQASSGDTSSGESWENESGAADETDESGEVDGSGEDDGSGEGDGDQECGLEGNVYSELCHIKRANQQLQQALVKQNDLIGAMELRLIKLQMQHDSTYIMYHSRLGDLETCCSQQRNDTADLEQKMELLRTDIAFQIGAHGQALETHIQEQAGINAVEEELLSYMQDTMKEILTDKLAHDCSDHHERGSTTDGVYTIYPTNSENASKEVWCDMTTLGGGWTVFQKRFNGSVNFFRGWNDYENGFGDIEGEYWLGNKHIHNISKRKMFELRIEMDDFYGYTKYAAYHVFKVEGAHRNYMLRVAEFDGNAGDSLSLHHNGLMFSTYDFDNDVARSNCAKNYVGGWWYQACHAANLNGLYLSGWTEKMGKGMCWSTWWGYHYSMKSVQMKIRPIGYPVFTQEN